MTALARRLPRLIGVLAAVAFIALITYGVVTQAPDTGIDDRLARAETSVAPAFELSVLQAGQLGRPLSRRLRGALTDGRVSLAELRGSPVVLNFWASWCLPCQEEAGLLERAWRRNRRGGVLFVGLDMQDVRSDAREFLSRFDITYLNVRDKGNDVARRYGVTGLPETFFITARGDVVSHVIGVISPEQLAAGIKAAREGRVLRTDEGGDRRPLR